MRISCGLSSPGAGVQILRVALATCLLLSAIPTRAQTLSNLSRSRPLGLSRETASVAGPTTLEERVARLIDAEEMALEGAVDPDRYRLAPGDRLALSIWGATDLMIELMVAADGGLIAPSVGVLQVNGKTLTQARELLRARAATPYPHSEISLPLVRPAMIRVPVTGLVAAPGTYELIATFRLADLIEVAGGCLEGADTRGIRILSRTTQEEHSGDLLTWATDGVEQGNPILLSGDRVHVPPLEKAYRVRGLFRPDMEPPVGRASAMDRPFESHTHLIPARPGDDLAFVLRAAGALGPDQCAAGVWLRRPEVGPVGPSAAGAEPTPTWIPLTEAARTSVEPGAIVEVPFCREWVAVGGSVTRPGLYPFLPGETVADYIYAAGGPSQSGRNSGWKMIAAYEDQRHDAAPADTVLAGARIWVPERRSLAWATVLAPVASALAIAVSIVAISR